MANIVQEPKKLTPQERAHLFAQSTRQHFLMLPAVAGAENSTVSINIPKARLGAKVRLLITGIINAQHATEVTYVPGNGSPYNFIRSLSLDTNFGFKLFDLSGRGTYFYNLLRNNGNTVIPFTPALAADAAISRSKAVQGLQSAVAPGTDNTFRMVVDLPITLNDREPAGIILLQNEETQVTVNINFGTVNDLCPASAGYTFAVSNIVVTPMVETFSIPAFKEGFPDISILKLVHEQNQNVAGAGIETVKLPTGTIYRKLIFYVTDAAGAGVPDGTFTGDFEMNFNQADTPYRISPRILSAINQEHYGTELPQGLFALDFTYQGMPNYGGTRDYIDSEKLSEMWLRISMAAAGRITIVSEQLARLRG